VRLGIRLIDRPVPRSYLGPSDARSSMAGDRNERGAGGGTARSCHFGRCHGLVPGLALAVAHVADSGLPVEPESKCDGAGPYTVHRRAKRAGGGAAASEATAGLAEPMIATLLHDSDRSAETPADYRFFPSVRVGIHRVRP
jgi:hypothetical protein